MVSRKDFSGVVLPAAIITRSDIVRLLDELRAIGEQAGQASLRAQSYTPDITRISPYLSELAAINTYDLNQSGDRDKLMSILEDLKDNTPVIHVSFASDPSKKVTESIVTWFRKEIHAHSLLQIGVDPSIIAGCVLRTSNKVFDFSLRQNFHDTHQTLREKVGQL